MGKGFIVTPELASELETSTIPGARVTFPYLNGSELYNRVDQTASRWVISFSDLSLEQATSTSPDALAHLHQSVKVERDAKKNENAKTNWWLYWRARPELYRSIAAKNRVIVKTRVSKTHALAFVSAQQVFSDALVVFADETYELLTLLQSSIHEIWAWKYCSTMKGDLRYSPTDCFENFPIPDELSRSATLGETYHEHRRKLMQSMQLGLTKTYNLFHRRDLSEEAVAKASKQEPEVSAQAFQSIFTLRDLHRQMDEAVLAAYGWNQESEDWGPTIALRHDFYEVDYLPENDRVRYTIHPDAPQRTPQAPPRTQPPTPRRRSRRGSARQEIQSQEEGSR